MIKISTPVIGYNGIDCGVRFENGKAEVETLPEHVLNWFKDQGYTVEKTDTPKAVEPTVENPENSNPENGDNETGNPEEKGTTQEESNNNDSQKGDENTVKPKTKAELLEEAKALGIEGIRAKATNKEIEDLIADKKIELEALNDNGDSDNESPEAGDNENSNPENGETGDEDPEKGE